jgi:nucleotide-binding universal stress UspA family protein
MFCHVLVPTDGSELSNLAVEKAIGFARETGAKLTFLYVNPRFPFLLHPEVSLIDAVAPVAIDQEAHRYAQEVVDAAVAAARAAGLEAEGVEVRSGAPYRGIVDVADQRHCDLILMASHHRSGLGAKLLGSETHKVLTHSKIPMLIYH